MKVVLRNPRREVDVAGPRRVKDVLKELRIYSQLIGLGHYLVCCDTHVEHIPEIVENRPRPWGLGNNPKTARDTFLKESGRFEVDQVLENKLLLTLHPGGYLRCCKQ